jgi:transketolase
MRAAFAGTLADLADGDPRIVLLTADLGYMALEPFAQRHPGRFLNVGVAEQNMVGMAAGLAEAGYLPFVYSIVPFAVLRPYEFIRNGPVHQHLAVRIVGVGGGVGYGHDGVSHYGLEDLAVLRVQPGVTVVVPPDAPQTASLLRATWDRPGPVYYRLEKQARGILPRPDGEEDPCRPYLLAGGEEVLFVTCGAIAGEALRAAELLRAEGLGAAVLVVPVLSPVDAPCLVAHLARCTLAVSVETHLPVGGLGSLVCELVAEHGLRCRVVRCGLGAPFDGRTGSQEHLEQRHGLRAPALAQRVRQACAGGAP